MTNGALMLQVLMSCAMVLLVIVIMRRRSKAEEKFPPGPPAWPLIGHLHLFSHTALAALSRKYGHMLGLRLGQQPVVVVSSPALAKEVLTTHDKLFAFRPPFAVTSLMLYGASNGVIFNHGPRWRRNRKICVLQLFTAKRLHQLEYARQQEMRTLLLSIHRHSHAGSSAIDLGHCVGHMSSCLLMRLLCSRAIGEVCDESLYMLMKELELEMVPIMGDFIPLLAWLDFFSKRRMRRIHGRLDKVYAQLLMERRESTSDLHDDLLGALLSQEEPLTELEIKGILHDILVAGVHTTALTIEWAMAELLKHPDCLSKLQSEIDAQLGEKRQVTDADLPRMSYLKCVIKEASRLHPVGPLLIPHISVEECQVQGYTIQAKTLMFVNVWAIGRDEQVWPNATEFMPDRFEGKDIDLTGQHFELLPLALSIVEVTLANLVRTFDWELPNGETHESINMDERMGITANRATPLILVPKARVLVSELPDIQEAYDSSK